jgi:hypothetical protein
MQCVCTILSSVADPVLQFFFTLSHEWDNFRKRQLHMKFVFDFSYKACHKYFLSLGALSEIRFKMYIGLSVKNPLFLSDFKETLIFSTKFIKKIPRYEIPCKSVQWELSCSTRTADRQTNTHREANSRFSKFYEGAE